jgi:hypothetical protein
MNRIFASCCFALLIVALGTPDKHAAAAPPPALVAKCRTMAQAAEPGYNKMAANRRAAYVRRCVASGGKG